MDSAAYFVTFSWVSVLIFSIAIAQQGRDKRENPEFEGERSGHATNAPVLITGTVLVVD